MARVGYHGFVGRHRSAPKFSARRPSATSSRLTPYKYRPPWKETVNQSFYPERKAQPISTISSLTVQHKDETRGGGEPRVPGAYRYRVGYQHLARSPAE